jgi:hypothetical protein
MFKKNIIISIYMIDIFDLLHYLIGLLIVGLLVCGIIKLHLYFSKDNIPIDILMNKDV